MAVLLAQQAPPDQDELVRFLEQHPAYYAIMKSALFIQLLKSLAEKAKNILMLKTDFPGMEQDDLIEMLGLLRDLGVVSALDAGSSRFYYTNEKGRQFLAIYHKTKEKFLGKQGNF